MIWVYTVTGMNKVLAREVTSLDEVEALRGEADWIWIDLVEPNDKELEFAAELVKEGKIKEDFKAQRIYQQPERVHDYFLFSIPYGVFEETLKRYPIYLLVKKRTLLTIRSKVTSKLVKRVKKTFEACVGGVCKGDINSSFLVGRLFHEVTNADLDVVMALRESIDKLEEKALSNPADRSISRSVFRLKREISSLERILWSQRELMLSIREGLVLEVKTTVEISETLTHAINNISRELTLIDSHNNALESVLSLQDLGLIHRVERNLIYLTFMALVVSVILILLEIDILSLLQTCSRILC